MVFCREQHTIGLQSDRMPADGHLMHCQAELVENKQGPKRRVCKRKGMSRSTMKQRHPCRATKQSNGWPRLRLEQGLHRPASPKHRSTCSIIGEPWQSTRNAGQIADIYASAGSQIHSSEASQEHLSWSHFIRSTAPTPLWQSP